MNIEEGNKEIKLALRLATDSRIRFQSFVVARTYMDLLIKTYTTSKCNHFNDRAIDFFTYRSNHPLKIYETKIVTVCSECELILKHRI